jgi:hemolysin activation/secretion protein
MGRILKGLQRYIGWVAAAISIALVGGNAFAAGAEPVAPRFAIERFEVEGNTLLNASEINAAVAGYTGREKDFSDIQRALEVLEEVYRNRGYGVVQVLLPEQDITKGVVRLRVIEPRIGKITVEGNKFYDEGNIRRSLPVLTPGATPNSRTIAQNLQLLTENPSKQTTLLLRAGASDFEVDAAIKVADERPYRFVFTADNSGTVDTGRFRTGFAVQHSNLFNRDHVGSFQYVTSPENPSKVTIFGAGYRIPLYSLNSSIDVFAGYSDVSSGTLQGLFNVSGSGTILGARYNLHLPKYGEYEHRVAAGIDYRAFKNNVTLVGVVGNLVPDITIHPVSLAYSGLWRMTNAEFGFNVAVSQNIPAGNDGTDSDFKAVGQRFDANASYRIWRVGANYTRVLPQEWQFRAVIAGQYTSDALVSGEQFGYGGPDSVRGFNVREIANDKGYSTQFEVYTPDLGPKFKWSNDLKLRLLGFYDMGITGRNSVQPGDLSKGTGGASVGLGARLGYGKHLSMRLDWANVIDAAGNQARDDKMVNATVVVQF